VPGTAVRQVARADLVGRVDARQQLDVVVTLKPRNADVLADLAARSSGRPPLNARQIQALFLPTESDIAAVRAYLGAQGLRFRSAKGLTLSFSGTAGASERAFGVHLNRYRDARGRSFRAADGSLQLPRPLAGRVAAIDGLDTFARHRPAVELSPSAVTPTGTCASSSTGPTAYQGAHGGYLPADLAAAGAYNFQPLLDAGADGDGEAVAFIEYSYYLSSNVTKFKNCFGITTPVTDKYVGDRTFDLDNQPEVVLDLQVTLGAAPHLSGAYVYMAKNTVSMATMLNQIVADQPTTNVHIISISWGLCEQLLPPSELSAVNSALQLAAVAGISVFSASGDFGSSDCYPYAGGAAVDDPSSQPFATAVGGTTLDLSSGRSEVVWNGGSEGGSGGGGLSMLWGMPSWQSSANVVGPDSSGDPCGLSGGYCRQVPDVALNADPQTGYIIYCTWPSRVCSGWLKVGGTSAAAPLLAGITADANEYSLANGGQRLGFASPFLYDRFANASPMFLDVDTGTNDILSLGKYSAGTGYDMATGLGAIDGLQFGQELAAYTPNAPPEQGQATVLTASPTKNKTITYGQSVTFSGVLKRAGTGTPLVGQVVWLEVDYGRGGGQAWRDVTDSAGRWSVTVGRGLSERLRWVAFYLGGEGYLPAKSASHLVYVHPKIGFSSSARRVNGHYVIRHNVFFDVFGTSHPNMAGQSVYLEWRSASSSRWNLGAYLHFDATGRAGVNGQFRGPGRYYMRWRYSGSTSKPWLSGSSASKLFVVS
jgi:kumamolisin